MLWRSRNTFDIYRCGACGFGFVYPALSQQAIESIYAQSGHGARFNTTSLAVVLDGEATYPNSTLDSIRLVGQLIQHHHTPNRKALDIGAGYGFFTRELLDKGFEVTPIELAANEQAILREMTGLRPVNTTFEKFPEAETYGVVVMSQILEHAADPVHWIQKVHRLLEKKGLVMIAVPHFNSWLRYLRQEKDFYIIPPEHLNYFTKKSLLHLLKENGFEVLTLETVSRLPFHKIKIPGIAMIGKPILKALDQLGLGMMLNLIARKR